MTSADTHMSLEFDMLDRLEQHIADRESRGHGTQSASRVRHLLHTAIASGVERNIDDAMYRARAYFAGGWSWND